MSGARQRWPPALALAASVLGFAFAWLSTTDYTRHLDRQIHDVHCSFVPGLGAVQGTENACRVAMYSPYAAVFRERYWGGVPIALFAVGAFAFFAAFSLYLVFAGPNAPRKARQFMAVASVTPLLVSVLMGAISALRLGQFCKTCVGIYVASALLAVGGITTLSESRRASLPPPPIGDADKTTLDPDPPSYARRPGGFLLVPAWLLALAVSAITPALLYVSALPNYTNHITSCGKLEKPAEPPNTLLHISPPGAKQPATLFVDPLCPTCKALHQRLVTEGILEQLDVTLVLFPLDSECNWMLDRPLHPGSCAVTKAIMCSEHRAAKVLDWAYENQDQILAAAKAGAGIVNVRAMIATRWPGLDACIDSKETNQRLSRTLRYIVNNRLPVSTPQVFLGDTRLCDEDSDMGLSYSIRKLAPGLRSK